MSHRFWVPSELLGAREVPLPAETGRQIARVLRLRAGDEITLFCGDGEECAARLREVTAGGVVAEVTSRSRPEVELPCRLHLAVAVLKGEKLEWVVQKATELGAARLSFLRTERTVVEAGAERWQRRRERYERIAREAAEQSGRVRVPEIGDPEPLAQALGGGAEVRCILAPESTRPLLGVLDRQPSGVLLLVGPEGGFTEAELSLAQEAGAARVGLGKRTLRAETAAVAAAALVAAAAERDG